MLCFLEKATVFLGYISDVAALLPGCMPSARLNRTAKVIYSACQSAFPWRLHLLNASPAFSKILLFDCALQTLVVQLQTAPPNASKSEIVRKAAGYAGGLQEAIFTLASASTLPFESFACRPSSPVTA